MSSIFSGTDEELFWLVRDAGIYNPAVQVAEWWPKQNGHELRFDLDRRKWLFEPEGAEFGFFVDAASIIFAAAMVWLVRKHWYIKASEGDDAPSGGWYFDVGGYSHGEGPSPLHAVLAAVSTIGGQTP